MKKFLLLAVVLYFASCKSLCGGEEVPPKDANLCYGEELFGNNTQCCFLKNTTGTFCHEFEEKTTSEDIKRKHPEYANYEVVDCPYKGEKTSANYLKAGFLLVTMLLL
jgi:hypothetical protein